MRVETTLDTALYAQHDASMAVMYILSDKIPRRVRFGKLLSEGSPSLPWQQGTGRRGWYNSGTIRKQFTKPEL